MSQLGYAALLDGAIQVIEKIVGSVANRDAPTLARVVDAIGDVVEGVLAARGGSIAPAQALERARRIADSFVEKLKDDLAENDAEADKALREKFDLSDADTVVRGKK